MLFLINAVLDVPRVGHERLFRYYRRSPHRDGPNGLLAVEPLPDQRREGPGRLLGRHGRSCRERCFRSRTFEHRHAVVGHVPASARRHRPDPSPTLGRPKILLTLANQHSNHFDASLYRVGRFHAHILRLPDWTGLSLRVPRRDLRSIAFTVIGSGGFSGIFLCTGSAGCAIPRVRPVLFLATTACEHRIDARQSPTLPVGCTEAGKP